MARVFCFVTPSDDDNDRADLIVVGTRGLGGFTGLRVGGVALKTLHRADRPVVLVPPT